MKEKEENREKKQSTISESLRADLLRSFSGHHVKNGLYE